MTTARELAERAAHNYQMLKCQLIADSWREDDCVPIIELHRGDEVQVAVLEDRSALPDAIVALAQSEGGHVDACVLSIEVYTSAEPRRTFYPLDDPNVHEGLLTVAVTRTGDAAIKLFHYYMLDDGGIQFEEAKLDDEKVRELLVDLKGLWASNNGRVA